MPIKVAGTEIIDASGNISATVGNIDGRDIAADGTKLDTIETNADVTDTTNVTAAGALMTSGGTMTGSITFAAGQAFDGRDVSADGTKLDGIESGATADQTASEILTAIKTVDGSGSGLDADTLDGVQGSSFLRSDTGGSISATTSSTTPVTDITRTGSGPGNGLCFRAANEYGNHSWGLVGEIRVNGVSGSDRPSISFSHGYNSNTWSVGFVGSDDNFRISTDHGFRHSSWGTARMTLDRSGNVTFGGNVTAYSDERLKDNIVTIDNALDKINAIRGVTYNRNDIEDTSRHAGVIAQEVEKVLPEVVSTDSDGIKTVAYGNMVGLLIEAIKELKAEIEELKNGSTK